MPIHTADANQPFKLDADKNFRGEKYSLVSGIG